LIYINFNFDFLYIHNEFFEAISKTRNTGTPEHGTPEHGTPEHRNSIIPEHGTPEH
jgi:hypothetical protein